MYELFFVASSIYCPGLSIPLPVSLEVSYQGQLVNYLTPGQSFTYNIESPEDLSIVPLMALPGSVEPCELLEEPDALLITHKSFIPDWIHNNQFLKDWQRYVQPGHAMVAVEYTSDDPSSKRFDYNDVIILWQKVNHQPLPEKPSIPRTPLEPKDKVGLF